MKLRHAGNKFYVRFTQQVTNITKSFSVVINNFPITGEMDTGSGVPGSAGNDSVHSAVVQH